MASSDLQKFGYVPEDTLNALRYLLKKQLIAADHMNFQSLEFDDCVRILASGFMHVRILAGRVEYIYGVLSTTPLTEKKIADRLADIIRNESIRGGIGSYQTLTAVELFLDYLWQEDRFLSNPFLEAAETGRAYVLRKMQQGIEHFKNVNAASPSHPDELDL